MAMQNSTMKLLYPVSVIKEICTHLNVTPHSCFKLTRSHSRLLQPAAAYLQAPCSRLTEFSSGISRSLRLLAPTSPHPSLPRTVKHSGPVRQVAIGTARPVPEANIGCIPYPLGPPEFCFVRCGLAYQGPKHHGMVLTGSTRPVQTISFTCLLCHTNVLEIFGFTRASSRYKFLVGKRRERSAWLAWNYLPQNSNSAMFGLYDPKALGCDEIVMTCAAGASGSMPQPG